MYNNFINLKNKLTFEIKYNNKFLLHKLNLIKKKITYLI
jgi:hypothetical protein